MSALPVSSAGATSPAASSSSSLVATPALEAGSGQPAEAAVRELSLRLVDMVMRAGGQSAEVVVSRGSELSVRVRAGEAELVHEAQSKHVGLRVFKDHRSSLTYTSDFSEAGLGQFVQNAVALCRLAEPDPLNELPGRDELVVPADAPRELHLWDDSTMAIDAAAALQIAKECEASALSVSDKLRAGHGSSYGRTIGVGSFACGDAGGILFVGSSRSTYQSMSVEVLCDDAGGKKRSGSYWSGGRFRSQLMAPEAVGREAGARALRRLGAEKIATCELPVVFDPELARTLLRTLAGVISGGAIYRKGSYLCGREGTLIASPLVNVVDDPLIDRLPGSRLFDGEGLPSRRNQVVRDGVLLTYLLDTYSARKLGRKSNGCAGRSGAGSPHVTTSNFILEPGTQSGSEIVADLPRGLYVTEMMGFGFNPVTGDFSRGAGGYLIVDGKLGQPVSEVTISANFDDLLKNIDAVGNDLDRRSSTMTPTVRVSRMTIAGK
ncbi:MAG TPA: TldD/PmbA family protein [Pseudomonadota bacterium]|nr:TldD/PmbA family protein [Pseudomonadota bacterium]